MVHSPSHRWVDGKLVERAIDSTGTDTKQITSGEVEDKAVKKPAAKTKKKAAKK